MTDLHPGVYDGPVGAEAIVINAIADESITIGSPVIIVAAATGELLPRVEPSASQGADAFGVCVGGDDNGTYGGSSEVAASAAGETVKVCIFGRCKVRVNGSTGAIALGANLTIDAVDGIAEVAAASDIVFGRALQASTGASDFIACNFNNVGVL
jgi:hypothetical protein